MFPLNVDYDQLKHNSGNYHTPFNFVQLLFLLHTAKLLSADWLRQRAFFLNHEGTSAGMASRYVEADEEFIEELRNTSENKNSKRSTDYWTNIFQQWAKTRGKNEQLESYEVPELNEALDNFAIYVINK